MFWGVNLTVKPPRLRTVSVGTNWKKKTKKKQEWTKGQYGSAVPLLSHTIRQDISLQDKDFKTSQLSSLQVHSLPTTPTPPLCVWHQWKALLVTQTMPLAHKEVTSLVLCVHSVASFLPLISTSSMSEGIQANTAIEDFPNCRRKCFSVFESKYG